jgi:shikimate dehydrogenase
MSFLDQVVGSFSTGAAGNPTVAMMDAAFGAEGLAWRYVNCEVGPADLSAAVDGARAMGWRGFNCSMPHKQAVIPLLDALSPSAELCQAVNCVVRSPDGARWVGHNTDGAGMVASCRGVVDPAGVEALVIGSGGAAHAIAVELALAGARAIHLTGRNRATTTGLATLVAQRTSATSHHHEWSEPVAVPPGVGLVVNATPVGMAPDDEAVLAVDWSTLAPGSVVADVVFNPADTAFLRAAAQAGATTIDGTGMLVDQAAENIRLWTGTLPDTTPMRAALDRALGLG